MVNTLLYVFDCDGVLREFSLSLLYQLYCMYGHAFAFDFEGQCPDVQTFAAWHSQDWRHNLSRLGIVKPADVRRSAEMFYAWYEPRITTFDWLEDVFSALACRAHIAIASNSGAESVRRSLNGSLSSYVTMVVGHEEVRRLKPHPDGLHVIMEKLHVAPCDTVMIGDTDADVQAGKRAGVQTAVVTWGATRGKEALQALGADVIISQPADILSL